MSNTPTTPSNLALVPPAGNLERVLREQQLSFRTAYNHDGRGHVSNNEREPFNTFGQTFQSQDCEDSHPSPESRPQSAPAAVSVEIESDPLICKYIRRTVARKGSCKNSRRSHQTTQEAVEHALSDLFKPALPKLKVAFNNAFTIL